MSTFLKELYARTGATRTAIIETKGRDGATALARTVLSGLGLNGAALTSAVASTVLEPGGGIKVCFPVRLVGSLDQARRVLASIDSSAVAQFGGIVGIEEYIEVEVSSYMTRARRTLALALVVSLVLVLLALALLWTQVHGNDTITRMSFAAMKRVLRRFGGSAK